MRKRIELSPDAELCAPLRCAREQWYLLRATRTEGLHGDGAEVLVRFLRRAEAIGERTVKLRASAADGAPGELLGWVQTPARATHLQLAPAEPGACDWLDEVVCHPVSERDPKCHPLANVPRWSAYRPPFPAERVILPPGLADLAAHLTDQEVRVMRPRSQAHLAKQIRGAACVLDPAWAREWGLAWTDLEQLAAASWLVVDLETIWRLLRQGHRVPAELITQSTPHGIMSARVEYADVATRGFALQDVFPYTTIEPGGEFAVRVLRADRAWKNYADEHGFATLLASETPSPRHSGDVLSAAQPVERGELIATDLPWLAAGQHGPLLAPRLARHALRMHLAAPLDDPVQHWNRWDDGQIVVRDIADLARRYRPLQTLRWPAADSGLVRLGIELPAAEAHASDRKLIIATGRIDQLAAHDGLPSEPMMIFMKMLARDAREQTLWARRRLRNLTVIWQFDSAAGRRYAVNYGTELPRAGGGREIVARVRTDSPDRRGPGSVAGAARVEMIVEDEGLLGDGSVEFQARLDARLRALIEEAAR